MQTPLQAPADSATVILLRECAPAGCEVLLLERNPAATFGGAHVFPGGRVDSGDEAAVFADASPHLTPDEAGRRLHEDVPPSAALSIWVAALRELFEEAGVLLAARDGVPLDFNDAGCRSHFAAQRAALLAGRLAFDELVTRERLTLATDELVYFSRWITPMGAPRRFDARFFVARLPAGQEPQHDEHETIATLWRTPAAALLDAERGALTLAPPTVRTLEDLDALGSADRIIEAVRARPFPPMLPVVAAIAGVMTILYPGDAAYERAAAGEAVDDDCPGARNRALMDGGRWRAQRRAVR